MGVLVEHSGELRVLEVKLGGGLKISSEDRIHGDNGESNGEFHFSDI